MKWTDALPVIGTFLGSPAGGLAGAGLQWLAEKLGASEQTIDGIKNTLSGMTPEQLLAAKKLDIEFQMFCMDNGIRIDLAQIAVNVEESKSTNWLVSGWRPAVGWIGAAGLAYAAIIEPMARFVAKVGLGYDGAFPEIDTMLTLQVLLGILGLGGMRSFDKKHGTSK